ncbi:MAG: integrase arm-type DNA-binding domain-containing protein [Gammaproteobacteria bacterium]|nr:integrase arm-type DNA-binding domain-containing protein [Gammaproteobacteria bacterium]
MPLTDTAMRNTKPSAKPQKLFDAGGLFMLVAANGGRWWHLKYRFGGKEKLLSLGTYPEVSLKDARDKRDALRKQIAAKIDPSDVRRDEKAAREYTFEVVARLYIAARSKKWSRRTLELVTSRLEKGLFPKIGKRPIRLILARELLRVLEPIQARGAVETAHRLRQDASLIFCFALAQGYVDRDPAADLRGSLDERTTKHHAAITDAREIGALLRAIGGYTGEPAVLAALRLAPHVFLRPGELRAAEWSEIDFDAAEWRVPANRMKLKETHLVPLSRQALRISAELRAITGKRRLVFPSIRTAERPISENTVNAALHRLGYTKEQMTGHGFRSMASTRLNESQKWHRDAIERQLAHGERDKVRASYNYAEHLTERRKMMQ